MKLHWECYSVLLYWTWYFEVDAFNFYTLHWGHASAITKKLMNYKFIFLFNECMLHYVLSPYTSCCSLVQSNLWQLY